MFYPPPCPIMSFQTCDIISSLENKKSQYDTVFFLEKFFLIFFI